MAKRKKVVDPKELQAEIVMLRNEVKELKEIVNMLLQIVMEEGAEEEMGAEFNPLSPHDQSRFKLGM